MAKLDYVSSSNGTTLGNTYHNLLRCGGTAQLTVLHDGRACRETASIWHLICRLFCRSTFFFVFAARRDEVRSRFIRSAFNVPHFAWEAESSNSHSQMEIDVCQDNVERIWLAAVVSTSKMSRSQFNCDLIRLFCRCGPAECMLERLSQPLVAASWNAKM